MNGKFEVIPYKDICIICRKDRKNLKPNIYLQREFLDIGETIRGNIIIACQDNENFKSLSKEQTLKYFELLQNISFNYNNSNDLKFRKLPNNSQMQNEDILKMILGIQMTILKFIKNNKN